MFSEKVNLLVKKQRETIDSPTNKREFIENLIFCYQFMRASHNLTACAAKLSKGRLKRYFSTHATEEIGHDEWLKNDLATEGVYVEKLAINPYAEAIAGVQYYNLFHNHPAYLLGYMAFLEMEPMTAEQVECLEGIYGVNLLKTLKYHAINDVGHSADLCDMLDDLDETLQPIVIDSVMTSADYFRCAMKRIKEASCPEISMTH